eukprot:2154438-Amphidinium_carterae.1
MMHVELTHGTGQPSTFEVKRDGSIEDDIRMIAREFALDERTVNVKKLVAGKEVVCNLWRDDIAKYVVTGTSLAAAPSASSTQ